MNDHTRVSNLRHIGIAECISFLVLLLIAMPVKYVLGYPLLVKYVGWAHGLLFILYIIAVIFAIRPMRWNFFHVLLALGASLIPLGPLLLERPLKNRLSSIREEGLDR